MVGVPSEHVTAYIGVSDSHARADIEVPEAQAGDQIALVRGGCRPLVLRQTSHGLLNLVTDSYVHGIMQGEAFDILKCHPIRIR